MDLPDTMSRLSNSEKDEIPGLDVQLHSLVSISDARLLSLRNETKDDMVLRRLAELVRTGWPSSIKQLHPDTKEFWSLRDDILVVDGLMLCGSRIIILEVARQRTLQSIHDVHQGEVKCKLRAKDAVYWPIYKDIEEMVCRCNACQEFSNAQVKCPMIPVDIPPHPWHTLGADLFYVHGKWFLLVTDYY